jgi:hypothetical protein
MSQFIYLSNCRGLCTDEYKNKVKNIMNEKITLDDLQKNYAYEKCGCTDDKKFYTEKCDISVLKCHCDSNSDSKQYACKYDCTQYFPIIHQHNGPCDNNSSCTCSVYHLHVLKDKFHTYYCDGTNLYGFKHDLSTHTQIYTYNCNHVCRKYHISTDPVEAVTRHNNVSIDVINKLLKESEICGERCRFSITPFTKYIEQTPIAK